MQSWGANQAGRAPTETTSRSTIGGRRGLIAALATNSAQTQRKQPKSNACIISIPRAGLAAAAAAPPLADVAALVVPLLLCPLPRAAGGGSTWDHDEGGESTINQQSVQEQSCAHQFFGVYCRLHPWALGRRGWLPGQIQPPPHRPPPHRPPPHRPPPRRCLPPPPHGFPGVAPCPLLLLHALALLLAARGRQPVMLGLPHHDL